MIACASEQAMTSVRFVENGCVCSTVYNKIPAWIMDVKFIQIKKLFSIKSNWYATSYDAFLTTCIFVPVRVFVLKTKNF